MKIGTQRRFVLAALLSLTAGVTFASGSDSFGGGPSGEQAQYNAGKAVYAQRLACPDCALSGKRLDKMLAQQVIGDMNITAKLTDDERQALLTYLKLRFKL